MPSKAARPERGPSVTLDSSKIALLYQASQAVLSTFDLDEVLNRILAIVRDHFRFQNGAVLLVNPGTQELAIRAHFGRHKTDPAFTIPFGKGLTGSAAAQKKSVYAPDVHQDPRYIEGEPHTKSELAVPLLVRDEVVGVLDFQSDELDSFDAETIDLLTLFSTQASIALQNARLYALERRRSAQLEAINAIARQTTAVVDLNELLDKLCHLILDWFPVDHVAISLLEDDRLTLRADQGRFTRIVEKGLSMVAGQGLSGMALAAGKPILENDVSKAKGYVSGFEETKAELCAPMIFFGERLGVLCLESSRTGAFEAADVQALESVADICAGAIQNALHFDRANKLAYVDGLTGLHNRRHFEKRIADELDRARRYNSPLAVLMLDIDYFKRLNDEFGHLLGDEVLRQISTVLTQQLRKVDVLCRYGGEEFAILIPETSGERALAVAEKLRRAVEQHVFPGVPTPVTVSVGVADYPRHGKTRDELVAAADVALYAAKQAGRNRVAPAGSEPGAAR